MTSTNRFFWATHNDFAQTFLADDENARLLSSFLTAYPAPALLSTPQGCLKSQWQSNATAHKTELKAWLKSLNDHINTLICQSDITTLVSISPTFTPTNLQRLLWLRSMITDWVLSVVFCAATQQQMALFAQGGYARSELLPQSDVDMLLLHDDLDENATAQLQRLVADLWDLGITPAIRLQHTSLSDAPIDDITVATSLIESRFLIGDVRLSNLPSRHVTSQYTAQRFFEAKYTEYRLRHHKYGNTEYVLEPNIKEGVGALRDIHFLHWIGKFYFGLPATANLSALIDKGFLEADECQALMTAKHFFWLVRHHLHTLDNKDTNTLSFGLQKDVAKQMGYQPSDNNPNHAPECLMRNVYRHAMAVAGLSEMLAELFFCQYLKADDQLMPLDERFYVTVGRFGEQLGAYDVGLFAKTPSQILTLFLLMGEHGIKKIHAKTLRALRHISPTLGKAFYQTPHHRALFLENLEEPNYLFHRLRLMKRTGVLGAYLPDFDKIIGLMQYDLFHRYTVDAHTLLLIRILHRFYKDDFGLLSTVYKGLDSPVLLVIAGLFHDIAKGRDGDHSELGAKLVLDFCRTHRLDNKDSQLVEWLVRHHLDMSITAQKKDIYDPVIIDEFAKFVGDVRHLDYLYVLTVADMNATNSQLWNNWRASLLKTLYLSVHAKLINNQDNTINVITQKQTAVLDKLSQTFDKQPIKRLWQGLPDSYFLKHSKSELAWHATAILNHKKTTPLITLIPHKNKSLQAQKLLIYTPNLPNLFAATVVILDYFGYAIYHADILTDEQNFALDTYTIVNKMAVNRSITAPHLQTPHACPNTDKLINKLSWHLQDPTAFFAQGMQPKPPYEPTSGRILQHFAIKTQISFEPTGQTHHLHITTKDRPSLLAKIGAVFGAFGIWVHTANINTLGERAEDVFCVSDGGKPITQDKQNALKDALMQALSDQDNPAA